MDRSEHVSRLREGVAGWNRWRARCPQSVLDLSNAYLFGTNLARANLEGVILRGADLNLADLTEANLIGADLRGANLSHCTLIRTNLAGADISGCAIYGTAVWDVKLDDTIQTGLIISSNTEPIITVDNLEVAQFIHLILNNAKIRDVIETLSTRSVLILGRFTPRCKDVLESVRRELRTNGYLPIMFDFDKPSTRSLMETVRILAIYPVSS